MRAVSTGAAGSCNTKWFMPGKSNETEDNMCCNIFVNGEKLLFSPLQSVQKKLRKKIQQTQ